MSEFEYKDLFIAEIDCDGRLRGLSPAHVEALAHSIEEYGQQTPVLVRRKDSNFKLMAGAHRIKALLSMEKQMVSARIYSGISDDQARLIEIDENLIRHELNALDRAVFLAERKAIYEEMYPDTKAGMAGAKARHGDANEMFSFAEATAEKLGLSKRAIQRAVKIATKIAPELRQKLADAGYIKEGELYNLSQQKKDIQGQIIDLILTPNSGLNVKAAADQIKGSKSTPPENSFKQYHRLMDVWSRADDKAQKLFLEFLEGSTS